MMMEEKQVLGSLFGLVDFSGLRRPIDGGMGIGFVIFDYTLSDPIEHS